MSQITRHHTGPRMSQIVEHGQTIYLAGQVGNPGDDVSTQTKTCLDKVDTLLAEVGADRTHLLQVTIWLADMADFAAMNAVWDGWVTPGHTPARACGEAKLATPDYLVEFLVTAAKP
jgi:enamine deaminase RidA (YjgF/YER057c/UK114 family)